MIVLSLSLFFRSQAHVQMHIEWKRGHFSHKKISHVINTGYAQSIVGFSLSFGTSFI